MSESPANLATTFVVTTPEQRAIPVPVTPSIYAELDKLFAGFAGHSLVAMHRFDSDWPTWERHPHGEEIVCLLSGRATLHLREAGGERRAELAGPGDFVIVPRATWHTARVAEPTTMLFVTPGEGTENRERPTD